MLCLHLLGFLGDFYVSNRKPSKAPQPCVDLQRLVNGPDLRLGISSAIGKELILNPSKGDNVIVVIAGLNETILPVAETSLSRTMRKQPRRGWSDDT